MPHIPDPVPSYLAPWNEQEVKAVHIHLEDKYKMTKAETVHAIDAIAESQDVTLESFAHLDKDKILRKIDRRIIPMLAALVYTFPPS